MMKFKAIVQIECAGGRIVKANENLVELAMLPGQTQYLYRRFKRMDLHNSYDTVMIPVEKCKTDLKEV